MHDNYRECIEDDLQENRGLLSAECALLAGGRGRGGKEDFMKLVGHNYAKQASDEAGWET